MVLALGHRVPDFELFDSEGQRRRLSEFTQKGATALAFFPFAFSGTCDREMCSFRDGLVDFGGWSTNVVGISVDSAFTLKVFRETYDLGFPLLSDFNKKVSKTYGVLQDRWAALDYRGVAKRAVFVLDRKSILRYKWVTEDPGREPPYGEIGDALRRLG